MLIIFTYRDLGGDEYARDRMGAGIIEMEGHHTNRMMCHRFENNVRERLR